MPSTLAGGIARHWVAIACLAGAVLVVLVHRDYGVTWDEGVQAHYGELVLAYVKSGGADQRFREYGDLRFYGPLVESSLALLYQGAPERRFDVRHLALGLLALALVPALAGFARGLGRPGIAPLAVLALALHPRLLGHAMNNSKDVPFAWAVGLFMAGLARLFGAGRRDWPSVLWTGAAAGLALAVRPGGLPLLVLFFCVAAWLGHLHGTARIAWRRPRDGAARAAALWVLALGILIASWPWAHEAPLRHPVEVALRAAAFDRPVPVLFAGDHLSSDALPRGYLPWFLLITTPLPVLVLAGVGIFGELRAGRLGGRDRAGFTFTLALCWLVVPVALAVLLRPPLYDGIRHFLFVLPPLAVLAAVGGWHAVQWLRDTRLRPVAWPAVAGLLLVTLVPVVRLHPYQSSYFGPIVGGLAGADGRYETDYWGASMREATLWIRERIAARAGDAAHPPTILLGSTSPYPKAAVEYAAGEGIQVVTLGELAAHPDLEVHVDYYLALPRYGMDAHFAEAAVVHRVERQGATLAVVRDMRGDPVHAVPGRTRPGIAAAQP